MRYKSATQQCLIDLPGLAQNSKRFIDFSSSCFKIKIFFKIIKQMFN